MPDREKVIKHFEHLLNAAKGNYQDFVDLTVDAGEEILALLKEQDNCENCAIAIEDRQPVVRCKECKHRPVKPDSCESGFDLEFPDGKCPCQCEDGWYSWYPPDNWSCAEGERKEDE